MKQRIRDSGVAGPAQGRHPGQKACSHLAPSILSGLPADWTVPKENPARETVTAAVFRIRVLSCVRLTRLTSPVAVFSSLQKPGHLRAALFSCVEPKQSKIRSRKSGCDCCRDLDASGRSECWERRCVHARLFKSVTGIFLPIPAFAIRFPSKAVHEAR